VDVGIHGPDGRSDRQDGGFTRQQSDDLVMLRFAQYQQALKNDRAVQREYFQPITIKPQVSHRH
jgi:hypothetical protein